MIGTSTLARACSIPVFADSSNTMCYQPSGKSSYTDTSYEFNLGCDALYNPLPWDFGQGEFKMPVMGSMKNISPYRLANRRKKAKAARKARRKNRK